MNTYIYSGECCLCAIGMPTSAKDHTGNVLHTGDIVMIAHGMFIDTDVETWDMHTTLTAVVSNQFQSFNDGSVRLDDREAEPFVMGLKSVKFDSPEWRVHLVKPFDQVVVGEHWKQWGFSYRQCEKADALLAAPEPVRVVTIAGVDR